ncbi:MAG: hypothetical protein HRU40_17700 [Saprospiraceae bacterium]|nr:hypothetical protein [Saprospiraceae bacterium]
MSLFTIRKGEHAAQPRKIKIRWQPQRFTFDVIFNDGRYHLKEGDRTDVDQYDWNKLCGLSFHLFTNHNNSFMIGWRYNLDTQKIELNRYQHKSGETIYDEIPFADIHPVGGRISGVAHIEYQQKRVRTKVQWFDPGKKEAAGSSELIYPFHDMPRLTREISIWFGGNETAPTDLYFLKKTGYR